MESLSPFQRIVLILLLLGISNSLPILARKIFRTKWTAPVDGGRKWIDGLPLLGAHKTWRGLFFSVTGTMLLSSMTPAGSMNGFIIAVLSMTGDLGASFIKRRMNLKNGARAVGLDQGIEALLPLVCLKDRLFISWYEVIIITVLFAVSELTISPILYRLDIRRHPY